MITLRPVDLEANPDDGALLLSLFAEARSATFAGLGLEESQLSSLLRMQHQAQWRDWRARFPAARFDLIQEHGNPVGRLFVDRQSHALVLIDITLCAARRGAGLGAQLIGRLLDEARASGLPVRLHVDHGNPARRLYERLGFVVTGTDELRAAMEWRP